MSIERSIRRRKREEGWERRGREGGLIHSVIIEPCKLHEYMQVVQSGLLCSRKADMTAGARGKGRERREQ